MMTTGNITRHDADLVDVDKELAYWRGRAGHSAFAQEDFLQYSVPVIRAACDIYVQYPHALMGDWRDELEHRLRLQPVSFDRAIIQQLAGQCWQRLRSH